MNGAFLRLAAADNVLVARQSVRAGEEVALEGGTVRLAQNIERAHKIAARAIAPGELVVKYGMPIGVATEAIAPGEHVHVHNIKSNYTPTYHLADRDGDEAA